MRSNIAARRAGRFGASCLSAFMIVTTVRAQDAPKSAGDLKGNVSSFFHNLGKGVHVPDPNAKHIIVARGILPGLPAPPAGYDYNAVCFQGEKYPTAMQPWLSDGTDGKVGGRMVFSAGQALPCDNLLTNGVFHQVANTAPAAAVQSSGASSPPSTSKWADSPGFTPNAHCNGIPYEHTPDTEPAIVKDAMFFCINIRGGAYAVMVPGGVRKIIAEDKAALIATGGIYNLSPEDAKVVGSYAPPTPAGVQANWDAVDRKLKDGYAKIQAQDAAIDAENKRRDEARHKALFACKRKLPATTDVEAAVAQMKKCMADEGAPQ